MNTQAHTFDSEAPSFAHFLDPRLMCRSLWRHRMLIRDFTVRNIASRYRGSWLGLLWSILLPLCMVAVYSFVFSVVFKSKWGAAASDSEVGFALTMFCGLVIYQLFAEPQGAAPNLMAGNHNYVKRVVFPLEILPLANLFAACFHASIGLSIIAIGSICFMDGLSEKIVCLPLLVLPILFASAGCAWFLASLGVFFRDVGHAVAVVLHVLYFLSPVFYPISAVPERYRTALLLNPLSEVMEDARRIMFWNEWPNWPQLGLVGLGSFVLAQLGYAWFMKTKRGFADVL